MKGGKRKSSASLTDDGTQPPAPPPQPPQCLAEANPSSALVCGDTEEEEEQEQRLKDTVFAAEKEEESQEHEYEEEEDDDEEEEEEEDGEDNGEQLGFEGGDGDGDGDGERPKLAEGYYEIEAVRRKRVRKGQIQYLIKWRGWPETANTWEPVDNLLSVSDVIDAFEESLRIGKQRSTRKRKRKYANTHPQTKKKQQQQRSPAAATYNVPAVKVRILEEPLPFPSLNDASVTDHLESNVGRAKSYGTSKQVNGNGVRSTFSHIEDKTEKDELDMKLRELRGPKAANRSADKGSANCQEAQVTEGDGFGLPKVDGVEAVLSGRCTGAKRRKSGSVKRFKHDSASSVANDGQPLALTNFSGPYATDGQQESHNVDLSNGFSCKSNFDDSKSICTITEIIKPISYSSSVTNNIQDVSVTFMAKRSDGKEVMVDNKFLKANNPLLLISFYEQHLRYSPM